MKVLLCHNYYRSSAPSGEDSVFRNERDMLQRNETDTFLFERYNDDINESTLIRKVKLAIKSAWSTETYNDLTTLIKKTRPDIAHFHNTFPLISPSAYAACHDAGIPVVQTLHNFRFICPGAQLQRNGHICEECIDHSLLPALLHRCYRKSFSATAAVVWMLQFNRLRKNYQQLVDCYIALTQFAADRLISGGLPKEHIVVKPNFLLNTPEIGQGGGGYAVYTGRLSEEKGLRTLLRAWKNVEGLQLKILGDGPLKDELVDATKDMCAEIEFLGFCDQEKVRKIVSKAEFQIVPSEWYEGLPMVVLEAYALGTPVIASRIGSLDSIVEDGITGAKFTAGDATDLASTVNSLWMDKHALINFRSKVRKVFDGKYTETRNYGMLMEIYSNTIKAWQTL